MRRTATREGEGGVVAEHLPLELLQPLARLDPELLDQRLPRLTVRRECFGLSPGAIEGDDELGAEVLAVMILGDQDFELGDQLAGSPESEVGLETVLQGVEAKLVQPSGLRREGLLVDDIL